MEDIKTLYPEPPKPIELELSSEVEKKKGEKSMSFWKGLQQFAMTVVIGGIGVVGFFFYQQSQASMPKESISAMISDEKQVLKQVQDSCFPALAFLKNEASCKLWLRHYRDLDKYAYSDSDLFNGDPEQEARTGEQQLKAQSDQAGNEQSPANH